MHLCMFCSPPPQPLGFLARANPRLRRHRRTPSPQSEQPGGCTLYHMVGLQGTETHTREFLKVLPCATLWP